MKHQTQAYTIYTDALTLCRCQRSTFKVSATFPKNEPGENTGNVLARIYIFIMARIGPRLRELLNK